MSIRFKLFLGFFFIIFSIGFLGYFSFQNLREAMRPLDREIPNSIFQMRVKSEMDGAVQLMRYYDEILTHSSSRYVFTQNEWWKHRYYAFKPEADRLIDQVSKNSETDDDKFLQSMRIVQNGLSLFREQSIELTERGEIQSAVDIIKGQQYWTQKKLLDDLVRQYLSFRDLKFERGFDSSAVSVRLEAKRAKNLLVKNMNLIFYVLIFVIGIALITGFSVTHSIAKPIEELKKQAEKVGQGDLSQKVLIESSDEIGVFSKTFNRMIEDLSDSREKLVRQEKLAAMGELAGMIGHEIRSPLGIIRNSVYFLNLKLKEQKDEKISKHLDILNEEVINADHIIEDTLQFARQKDPICHKTDIAVLLDESLSRKKIPENIQICKNFSANLPLIDADGTQLQRVFYNLIWNAVQAMDNGGSLTIHCREKQNQKNQQVIETVIEDTGEGISKKNLEKIFEPLFSTKAKGTGLGMSVCCDIVQAHQGSLTVESEIGQGTTVKVSLPVEKEKGDG